MKLALLKDLNAAIARREAVALVTSLESGAKIVVSADSLNMPAKNIKQDNQLITFHLPDLKMVITGAVHISQQLIPLARAVAYEPIIIDPRTAFATPERFAGVELHAQWPQDVLKLDRFTAFIALTHDPKIDDPALEMALRAGCFYIGALGSKKTHAKRLERLTAKGLTHLDRIKAPIGLDIGAVSPAEIALAIMAEVLKESRNHVFW